MSPIVARAAMRTASRRNFSLMTHMRSVARSFEPHPFQRLPISQKPQGADWGRMVKRTGKTFAIYAPGMAFVLCWPMIGKTVYDGRM